MEIDDWQREGWLVTFEPMSQAAFQDFLAVVVDEYAAEHVRGGRWTAEEAPVAARRLYEKMGYEETNVVMRKTL